MSVDCVSGPPLPASDDDARRAALKEQIERLERHVGRLSERQARLAAQLEAMERRLRPQVQRSVWQYGLWATVGIVWRALRSLASKMVMHYLSFVYFTKLHRLIVSLSYKYYVLTLLR